jgi:hypothetical protein
MVSGGPAVVTFKGELPRRQAVAIPVSRSVECLTMRLLFSRRVVGMQIVSVGKAGTATTDDKGEFVCIHPVLLKEGTLYGGPTLDAVRS